MSKFGKTVSSICERLLKRRFNITEKHLKAQLQKYLKTDNIELSEELRVRCNHYVHQTTNIETWTIDKTILLTLEKQPLKDKFTVFEIPNIKR